MTVPFWWSVATQILTIAVAIGVVWLNNRQQTKRDHEAWLREKQTTAYEKIFRTYNALLRDPVNHHEAIRKWADEVSPSANLYLPMEVNRPINALIAAFQDNPNLTRAEAQQRIMQHWTEVLIQARTHTGAIAYDR